MATTPIGPIGPMGPMVLFPHTKKHCSQKEMSTMKELIQFFRERMKRSVLIESSEETSLVSGEQGIGHYLFAEKCDSHERFGICIVYETHQSSRLSNWILQVIAESPDTALINHMYIKVNHQKFEFEVVYHVHQTGLDHLVNQ